MWLFLFSDTISHCSVTRFTCLLVVFKQTANNDIFRYRCSCTFSYLVWLFHTISRCNCLLVVFNHTLNDAISHRITTDLTVSSTCSNPTDYTLWRTFGSEQQTSIDNNWRRCRFRFGWLIRSIRCVIIGCAIYVCLQVTRLQKVRSLLGKHHKNYDFHNVSKEKGREFSKTRSHRCDYHLRRDMFD